MIFSRSHFLRLHVVINNKSLELVWEGSKNQMDKELILEVQVHLFELGVQVTHPQYVLSNATATAMVSLCDHLFDQLGCICL